LQEAVGFNSTNSSLNDLRTNLYFQGEKGYFYEAFTPIYNKLQAGQYQEAGEDFGPVYEKIGANATNNRDALNSIFGFKNSVFLYFNASSPTAAWECFNETSAQLYQEFILGWAKAVGTSGPFSAYKKGKEWFESTGNALMAQLASNFECEDKTPEFQDFNQRYGFDIYSKDFQAKLDDYCQHHQDPYYYQMQQVYESNQKNDTVDAGFNFAIFLEKVKRKEDEIMLDLEF